MASPVRVGLRLLRRTASTADNPPSNQIGIFARADGLYYRLPDGTEHRLGAQTFVGADHTTVTAQPGDVYVEVLADGTTNYYTGS